jgi:hypothetical protein
MAVFSSVFDDSSYDFMTPYFSTQPKLFRYGINIYEGG